MVWGGEQNKFFGGQLFPQASPWLRPWP